MHDPTGGFGGVDWATDDHAVCVVNDCGEMIVEFDVANTAAGLTELCRRIDGDNLPERAAKLSAKRAASGG